MFEWIKNSYNSVKNAIKSGFNYFKEENQKLIDQPELFIEEFKQNIEDCAKVGVKSLGYVSKGYVAVAETGAKLADDVIEGTAEVAEKGGKMAVNASLEAENWFDKIGNIMGKPFKWGFGLVEKGARKIKNFFEDGETKSNERIAVREKVQEYIKTGKPLDQETQDRFLTMHIPGYDLLADENKTKPKTISQTGSEEKGEFNKSKEELVIALTGLKEGKPLDNETKEDLLKVIQRLSDQSALLYEKTTESIAAKEKLEEHIKSGKPLKETSDLLLTMMIPGYTHIVNENKTLSGVSEKAQEPTSNTVDPWQQFSEKTEKSASKALDTWQKFMEKEGAEMLIKLKEQKPSKVSKQDLSQHLQENGSTTVSLDDNPFHAKESITLNNYGKE